MRLELIEDQLFDGKRELVAAEYYNCSFKNCQFTQADFSQFIFEDCVFEDCDLSMLSVNKTALRQVHFKSCKILAVHFEDANSFSLQLSFEDCSLNFSFFTQLNIEGIVFKNCSLEGVDFTESKLAGAIFDHSNLKDAIFEYTDLRQANLSTAYNYRIQPEQNTIKQAIFGRDGLAGLLQDYDIIIQ